MPAREVSVSALDEKDVETLYDLIAQGEILDLVQSENLQVAVEMKDDKLMAIRIVGIGPARASAITWPQLMQKTQQMIEAKKNELPQQQYTIPLD